jgi:hypothetical protein
MNFSNKIIDLSIKPKYLNTSKMPLEHIVHVKLSKLESDIYVFFKTVKKEELEVEIANYFTDLKGEYLGVIDGFFALMQNRPLEAIDRFPIKELDYYLRDFQNKSAFSGYSQEIYEILSIGEQMKAKVFGEKNLGFQYDPTMDGEFFDLSTAEQFELMEEFFAYYIYPNNELKMIELVDIDDFIVIKNATKDVVKLLVEKLKLNDSSLIRVI